MDWRGLLLSALLVGGCQPRLESEQPAPSKAQEPAFTWVPSPALSAAAPAPTAAAVKLPEPAKAPQPGRADLDPENDQLVAPPDPVPDCAERLEAAGVTFRPGKLPIRDTRYGIQCGAHDAVIFERGPGDIRYNAQPLLSCGMALALARFESLLQVFAEEKLGSRVTRISQGGTYSCRKMARFSRMVSEHSYANAIDLRAFRLADGRLISVKGDYGRPDQEAPSVEGQFLRELANRAFDQQVFSVVLTSKFDKLHADHFHVDLARYRVDGSR